MDTKTRFLALSYTLLIALGISYVLCIALGLIFDWQMVSAWAPLMPGFTWPLTGGGFVIGLIWVVIYSFYTAAVLVFPYDMVAKRLQA